MALKRTQSTKTAAEHLQKREQPFFHPTRRDSLFSKEAPKAGFFFNSGTVQKKLENQWVQKSGDTLPGEMLRQADEAGKAALQRLKDKYDADSPNNQESAHVRPKKGQTGGTAAVTEGDALPAWLFEMQNLLAMRAQWTQVEEDAQTAMKDYLVKWAKLQNRGRIPSNLSFFFDFVGRSAQNNEAAKKGKFKRTGDTFWGYLDEKTGKASKDWCTGASTKALGKAFVSPEKIKLKDNSKGAVWGKDAYAAHLFPGDIVQYLFNGCQFGGHAATVVQDFGDSFVDVSGNTGRGIGVGMSQRKRLKEKPANLDLGMATPSDPKKRAQANEHLGTVDFQDGVLVYGIWRFGQRFEEQASDATTSK